MSLGSGEKREGFRKEEQKGQTLPHARRRMSDYPMASNSPDVGVTAFRRAASSTWAEESHICLMANKRKSNSRKIFIILHSMKQKRKRVLNDNGERDRKVMEIIIITVM